VLGFPGCRERQGFLGVRARGHVAHIRVLQWQQRRHGGMARGAFTSRLAAGVTKGNMHEALTCGA
jgi:hypothetical protein